MRKFLVYTCICPLFYELNTRNLLLYFPTFVVDFFYSVWSWRGACGFMLACKQLVFLVCILHWLACWASKVPGKFKWQYNWHSFVCS